MGRKNKHLYVEQRVKPGWYMYWRHQTYRIVPFDSKDSLTVYAENTTTSEVRPFSFTELWLSESGDEDGPIFAPTLEQLHREIDTRHPIPDIAPTTGIPAKNIAKADYIISAVEQVKKLVPTAMANLEKERKERDKTASRREKRQILRC